MGETRIPPIEPTQRTPLNGAQFAEQLRIEAARVNRYGGDLGIIHFTLDNQQAIAERLGPAGLERLLVNLGAHLARKVRLHDYLARLGSGDFAVLVPAMSLTEVTGFAVKLRRVVHEYQFDGGAVITASFGLTEFRRGEPLEAFELRSRHAMERAQAAGGNRVVAARSGE